MLGWSAVHAEAISNAIARPANNHQRQPATESTKSCAQNQR